jgi:RsiW-degrading membrane proteinase PrsW (M82 family)
MPALTLEIMGYAFLGGLLPALVWLYFLLREDSRCPEPRSLIIIAFLAGMFSVLVVLPFETIARTIFVSGTPLIIAWAAIEESVKYIVACILVLWRRAVNESLDMVICMVTIAIGFAALENTLFLLAPFAQGHFLEGIVTNNLRFVGSTLLHIVASSAVGFALAFSYKLPMVIRSLAGIAGLILAIALHALFNFFIIEQEGAQTLYAFFTVWIGLVVFFALFEILRYFRYRNLPKNTC